MSSIPSSVMPHSHAAEPKREDARPSVGARIAKIVTAPALFTLGLSLMALSGLARRVRPKPPSR